MEESARRGREWIGVRHDSSDHLLVAESFEPFKLGAAAACEMIIVVERTVGVVNDNNQRAGWILVGRQRR